MTCRFLTKSSSWILFLSEKGELRSKKGEVRIKKEGKL